MQSRLERQQELFEAHNTSMSFVMLVLDLLELKKSEL